MAEISKFKTTKTPEFAVAHPTEVVDLVRDAAIDRFRGALVILMVIGDFLEGVEFVPSFLKHAPDIGFTIADAVAPAFVFLIGLNFGPSFARRLQAGWPFAYRYFLTRYLTLIGIGSLISAGTTAFDQPSDWGVLQALGVAGLICLAVIRLPTWARFIIAALMLLAYQYLLDTSILESVLGATHGGFLGALSWAALLVLSTAVADVWRKGLAPYVGCMIAMAVAATGSAFFVPVSKNRVSLSYILLTLVMSGLVFLALERASRVAPQRRGVLCWWGENSLTFYLLHLVLLAVFVAPPVASWYVQAPAWLAIIQLSSLLAFMTFVAWRIRNPLLTR